MRNYLQSEGKLKPTHHKSITITYEILRPRFLRYKLQARRKSWRNKTASLNLEKDGTCTKLWRLTKQLNNEGNGRATTTLEADGQLLSGKQAAHKFAVN